MKTCFNLHAIQITENTDQIYKTTEFLESLTLRMTKIYICTLILSAAGRIGGR